jgi:hypothetical protein
MKGKEAHPSLYHPSATLPDQQLHKLTRTHSMKPTTLLLFTAALGLVSALAVPLSGQVHLYSPSFTISLSCRVSFRSTSLLECRDLAAGRSTQLAHSLTFELLFYGINNPIESSLSPVASPDCNANALRMATGCIPTYAYVSARLLLCSGCFHSSLTQLVS